MVNFPSKCPTLPWRDPTVAECNRCEYHEGTSKEITCSVKYYVNFGDLCRNEIGIQCQYGSHYLKGINGSPKLGEGLRIKGNPVDYHSLLIHKDDAPVFKERVESYLENQVKIPR
jgi:hypothetical protein